MNELFRGVDCDIPRAGNDRRLSLDLLISMGKHIAQEIYRAIPGRLGSHLRTAILGGLAGQHTLPPIGDPLVLAEHVTDLARTDPDITRRHIDIRADVAMQLGHETLAKAHDLMIAFPFRIEIRSALTPAQRQAGERILEGLLESQKLEHAFIYAGMKADPTLVWSDGVVVLHSPATLDANILIVILPADPETYDTIGFRDPAQDLRLVILFLVLDETVDVLRDLLDCLNELFLPWIALFHAFHERIQIYMPVVNGRQLHLPSCANKIT